MQAAEELKSKFVSRAVRNVQRGYIEDEKGRGMYRPEVKLDLQRLELSAVRVQRCRLRRRQRRLDEREHLAGLDVITDRGQFAGGWREGASRYWSTHERSSVRASGDLAR